MANDFSAVTKQLIEDRKLRQAELEAQKELLEKMGQELESVGLKAEDNAEYNKKSLELDKQQLKFRLKGADSPAARKEIKQEQAAAANKNQNLLGKIASGVTGMFGKMGQKVKGVGKGVMAILKGTLLAGAFLAILAFLESPYWTKTKAFIVDTLVPAIANLYENILKPIGVIFKDYFIATWENIKTLFDGLGKSFELFANGEWWEAIKTLITSIGTFLLTQIDLIFTTVYNTIATIFGFGKTDSVLGSILGFLTDTYDAFILWIGITWNNIKSTITETFTDIKDFFVNIFTFVSEGISGTFTGVTSFITDMFGKVKTWFTNLFTWSTTEDDSDSFVVTTVKTAVNAVKTFLGKMFKFDSTSNIIASAFNVITFLPNIIKDGLALVTSWLLGLFGFDAAAETAANVTNWSIGSMVVEAFKKVKEWISGLFDFKVSDLLPNIELPDFSKIIRGIISSVFPETFLNRGFFGVQVKDFVPQSLLDYLNEDTSSTSLPVASQTDERPERINSSGLERGMGGMGGSPTIVNAPTNTITNSQSNMTNTSTPMFHPSPLLGAVNAAN
jgi:hypothetical protein